MSAQEPTVSIVLPTYNRENLIHRPIQSVLGQTYEDYELIIVDDASPDSTRDVIEGVNGDKVRYIRHETNKGPAKARNTGIEAAEGEYLAFIDDDDAWLPWKLAIQLSLLSDTADNVGILFSSFVAINERTGELSVHFDDQEKPFQGIPSRWLVKAEVFDKVGGFDGSFEPVEDLDLTARILQEYTPMFDNTPVAFYYEREESISHQNDRMITGREMLLTRHHEVIPDELRADNLFHLSISYIEQEEFQKARDRAWDAIKLCRNDPKYFAALLVSLLESRSLYRLLRWIHRS